MFFLVLGKTTVARSAQSQKYKFPYMLPRQHHRSEHSFFYYYYSIDTSVPCKLEIWFCFQKPFFCFLFSLFFHWERKVVEFTSELFLSAFAHTSLKWNVALAANSCKAASAIYQIYQTKSAGNHTTSPFQSCFLFSSLSLEEALTSLLSQSHSHTP